MAKDDKVSIEELMFKRDRVRNIGIIAHIDHGKSTLTDSLLAGAGMLSMRVAGTARKTDSLEEEQQRGITIQASAVSMVHGVKDEHFLINLIDTPGHVDFGGEVTRAMRAVDGALVVVDAVEGIMPQTETVLRQAMSERVEPVLFINKVDRLFKELKLKPEDMQKRFLKIMAGYNKLIQQLAPEEFKEKWKCKPDEGTVGFGSAVHRWALSFPIMKQTGITFKQIKEAYEGSDQEIKEKLAELEEKVPLHQVILDMVVKHLPNPLVAQKYRIPKLWDGDLESEIGKSLMNVDENGPLVFVVTKVIVDPQAGEITFGRVFSGSLKRGMEVYLNRKRGIAKTQQIFTVIIEKRITQESVPAGNTAAVIGLKGIGSGETVSNSEIVPFERIKHLFDPVVTKAIEAKNPKDLPKLIQVLREISQEDPTIQIKINEESGEQIISGLGELHLEWTEHKIKKYKNMQVVTSQPIVIYRETIQGTSPEVEGKSPNKHNKFYLQVEPLEQEISKAIREGELPEGKIRKKDVGVIEKLKKFGYGAKEAKRVKDIFQGNLLYDNTKGIVHVGEVMELIIAAFREVMEGGPVAGEPVTGVKLILNDMKLHEDAIHRGPMQVKPALRNGIRKAFSHASPLIFEPVQTVRIDSPIDYMGSISKQVQTRRGQILDMEQGEDRVTIKAKMPVARIFGFTSDLRSGTEGRGAWFLVDSKFEKLPKELQEETIKNIRQRKGLST
ncbi:MAG: elongation factor EF-2 [Nanoarchaeota archaeon]|nr:elongation factor EF-2 [Nanoarchaeota archaeon]